ncbi:uncharacterized protein LOC127450937 [Myxocyprinus asiaticus]|uniref:uncharacterized protein LOC127450937 n=1 Tax=Myxocyprinus asiaticus TaxID=70543 RepID=UPI0022218502|nr:uncharacterized protein LOC127450937 [Myxocyprinus asiaticus]
MWTTRTKMSLTVTLFLSVVLLNLCNLVSSADEHKFKGENYTIKCPAAHKDALGVYLNSKREVSREVLYYYFKSSMLTLHEDYKGRVKVKVEKTTLIIDIFNLQMKDSGFYWCSCNLFLRKCDMTTDKGVFLLVNEIPIETATVTAKKSYGMNDFLIPVAALAVGSVLLLLILVAVVWLVPKIKEQSRKNREEEKRHNGIYVDMRCKTNDF